MLQQQQEGGVRAGSTTAGWSNKKSPSTIHFNHRIDKHLPGQFILLETRSKENIHLGWLMNVWTGLMYCTFIHINTVRIWHDLPSQHSLWEPLVCTRVISDRIGWTNWVLSHCCIWLFILDLFLYKLQWLTLFIPWVKLIRFVPLKFIKKIFFWEVVAPNTIFHTGVLCNRNHLFKPHLKEVEQHLFLLWYIRSPRDLWQRFKMEPRSNCSIQGKQ